jgi:hypothetical protein
MSQYPTKLQIWLCFVRGCNLVSHTKATTLVWEHWRMAQNKRKSEKWIITPNNFSQMYWRCAMSCCSIKPTDFAIFSTTITCKKSNWDLASVLQTSAPRKPLHAPPCLQQQQQCKFDSSGKKNLWILCFLYRALWYNYVMQTNKMHNFFKFKF